MTNAVSKEMLKSALVELAQSEREFFVALLSDTLAYALALPDAAPPAQSKQKTQRNSRRIPLPVKVNPTYRPNSAALRQQYAVDKTALLSLRALFADAPTAEAIIATLRK